MQINKLCYNSSHMHVKYLSMEGGGGGGERSITINNLFDEIQWFETLSNLDVGGGRRGLVSIAPSALAIVNIEDSDWLEPSIFNSLTHSF